MDNPWDDVQRAVTKAQNIQSALEQSASDMGRLLVGNLRHVNAHTLRSLKRELAAYNLHTRTWRQP